MVNQVCGVNLMDGDVIVSGSDGMPTLKRNQSMTSRHQNQSTREAMWLKQLRGITADQTTVVWTAVAVAAVNVLLSSA